MSVDIAVKENPSPNNDNRIDNLTTGHNKSQKPSIEFQLKQMQLD